MKERQDLTFTVNTDANKNRKIYIYFDAEYPETKEEGIEKIRSSTGVISEELLYMIGCIHSLKASFLRPNSKKKWFDSILEIMDNMNEIQELLSVHPYQVMEEKLCEHCQQPMNQFDSCGNEGWNCPNDCHFEKACENSSLYPAKELMETIEMMEALSEPENIYNNESDDLSKVKSDDLQNQTVKPKKSAADNRGTKKSGKTAKGVTSGGTKKRNKTTKTGKK